MKRATRLKTGNRKRATGQLTPLAEGLIPLRKNGHRDWESLSDDKLVSFAKKLMDEKAINGRWKLNKEDPGLYGVLRKRELLDRIGFEEKRSRGRPWKKMKDKELIEHAKRFLKERGIGGKHELKQADPGLHSVLARRRLLDRIDVEEKLRSWGKMKDKVLIKHARKFMKENGIGGRKELEKADRGLYVVLKKRRLLDEVGFEEKRRSWASMSCVRLIIRARKFMKENGICGRRQLYKADQGLYKILRRRALLDRIGFERKLRSWNEMSDDEIIASSKSFMDVNGIRGKHELKQADQGLYQVLRKRGLMGKIDFEEKLRYWGEIKDEVLIEQAIEFIKENGISGRKKLYKEDNGLYQVLNKRKLLDRVFSDIEQTKQQAFKQQLLAGLTQAADAMERFGERR